VNDGGTCYIGLKRESSFLLLIYDLVINVWPFSGMTNLDISNDSIFDTYLGVVFISVYAKCATAARSEANLRYRN